MGGVTTPGALSPIASHASLGHHSRSPLCPWCYKHSSWRGARHLVREAMYNQFISSQILAIAQYFFLLQLQSLIASTKEWLNKRCISQQLYMKILNYDQYPCTPYEGLQNHHPTHFPHIFCWPRMPFNACTCHIYNNKIFSYSKLGRELERHVYFEMDLLNSHVQFTLVPHSESSTLWDSSPKLASPFDDDALELLPSLLSLEDAEIPLDQATAKTNTKRKSTALEISREGSKLCTTDTVKI